MRALDIPFNVDLTDLSKFDLSAIRPVSSLDYYENVNGNLHEDGLFSIGIFGRVGDEMRDRRFSYIDIKTTVFHPVVFQRLIQLRGLYRGILAGTHYVLWSDAEGDFVPSTELNGKTGYAYFLEHWEKIRFKKNKSDIRTQRIQLIEKYRKRALVDKILVIPAGLRDIEVGDDGRTVVADINSVYRKILSISRTLAGTNAALQSLVPNISRHLLQKAFNEVYDTIETMLTDKRGFIQNRWGSRRIFNGTRNVITSMDTSVEELGGINAPSYTDTIVGLYQMMKAILPVTIHHLKTNYLDYVFSPGNGTANLVDPLTLKKTEVRLSPETYDRWTTVEGLEKVISSYSETSRRDRAVKLDGYYMALIYTGQRSRMGDDPPFDGEAKFTQSGGGEKVFKIFHSIDELPEGFDRSDVRPINLVELLYHSGYRIWNNYPATVTRYPITGTGSVYPTTVYTKTTIVGEVRYELGGDWNPLGPEYVAKEFPTYTPLAYLDSLVIPPARLAGLGADFRKCYIGVPL